MSIHHKTIVMMYTYTRKYDITCEVISCPCDMIYMLLFI